MFYTAIKTAYPHITIISSVSIATFPTPPPAGVVEDLHIYDSVEGTVATFNAFDNTPPDHPVLVGEYASGIALQDPTLQSATSEAVMFLGLERNSDRVIGCSHGALIKSIHDEPNYVAMMKHTPDQIVFSFSYFVAKLFAHNYGSQTLPVTSDSPFGPLYWSATKDDSGTYFVKIVNYDGSASTPVTVVIPGSTGDATLTTLTAPDGTSANTLGNTESVWTETVVRNNGTGYNFILNGNYINAVLRV